VNPKTLIRNLAFGFLPLLAYIIADEIFTAHFGEVTGTKYALIFAIGLGFFQAVFIYIREHRLDKMVILDTSLLLLLGAVSLFSGNDLFFKLKPAIVEGLLAVLLFIMAFFKPNLLILFVGHLGKEFEFTETNLQAMRKSTRIMFVLIIIHTGLIVFSAFFMSKEAWGFISGPLLYILFGIYFVLLLVIRKLSLQRTKHVRNFTFEPTRSRIRTNKR